MPANKQEMSYIARKTCGCIAATFVDNPTHRHYIAKALHDWILRGWMVERVPVAYVRENWPDECPHKARQLSPVEVNAFVTQPSEKLG